MNQAWPSCSESSVVTKRRSLRSAAWTSALLATTIFAFGCAAADAETRDEGSDTEPSPAFGGIDVDGLSVLDDDADSQASQSDTTRFLGFVEELGATSEGLDEDLGAYLDVVDACVDEGSCENVEVPTDLIAQLERYVRVVGSLVDAALVIANSYDSAEHENLAQSGMQWHDAALIAARAAVALLNCVDDVDLEVIPFDVDDLRECAEDRDLYYAALLDSKRLAGDFRDAFNALTAFTPNGG